jgi:hypothetical protein
MFFNVTQSTEDFDDIDDEDVDREIRARIEDAKGTDNEEEADCNQCVPPTGDSDYLRDSVHAVAGNAAASAACAPPASCSKGGTDDGVASARAVALSRLASEPINRPVAILAATLAIELVILLWTT